MEKVKVKDFMVPANQYITIPEDATIVEAVLALEEAFDKCEVKGSPFRAVLVRGEGGRVIGKLDYIDILRSLEPKYSELGDLRRVSGFGLSAEFLKAMMGKFELWQQPLEDLCRKVADLKVGSVVKDPIEGEVIDQEASLNQAVHHLIMGHFQSLLVTSKGEVVGILRLLDVFQEVARRIKACRI